MIGRDRELAQAEGTFAEAERKRAPIVVRVTGEPGIGKSCFVSALSHALDDRGWFTIDGTCHAVQRHTPFLVSNRIVATALVKLGDDAERYTGGLEDGLAKLDATVARLMGRPPNETALDPESYALVFRRLFEGIAADRNIAILCDDAQWIDGESASALAAAAEKITTGSFSLVVSQRAPAGDAAPAIVTPSLDISLGELTLPQSLDLVRMHLGEAPPALAEAVAHHAAGSPLEIVMVAEELRRTGGGAEQVERSLRNRIARHVAALDDAHREFIQLCALLGEPIEYRILSRLCPDANALADLLSGATHYLVADGPDFRFRHALLADAVKETIAVPVPLHRRILNAFTLLPELELNDYERVAMHAHACGERKREHETYVELATQAHGRQAWSVVIRASEKALAVGRPVAEGSAQFFYRYAWALRAFDREPEAAELLLARLSTIDDPNEEEGTGDLIAVLVTILWELERDEQAIQLYQRYVAALRMPRERASLIANSMYLAVSRIDEPFFRELSEQFDAVTDLASARAKASRHAAHAALLSALGEPERSRREMASALAYTDPARPVHRELLAFASLLNDFREAGCDAMSGRLAEATRRIRFESNDNFYARLCEAWIRFFSGDWERALTITAETYRVGMAISRAALILAVPAAIGALCGKPIGFDEEIGQAAHAAVQGRHRDAAVQIVPWHLIRQHDSPLEQFARDAASAVAQDPPRFTAIGYVPSAFVLWAKARGELAILSIFARNETSRDRAPWAQANWELARALSLEAIGDPMAAGPLLSSAAKLRALGAPFLAAYATERGGAAEPADHALLERLGVLAPGVGRGTRSPHPTTKSILTPREWDVARLVAEGATNRSAAEALFLSQRTVEVHLNNIFGKLGLASRAQLVRWLLQQPAAYR